MLTSTVTNRMSKNRKKICDIKRGNYLMHSESVICGMHTQHRQDKGNKDDITSYKIEILKLLCYLLWDEYYVA